MDGQLSFAENLKNLLANQSAQDGSTAGQSLSKQVQVKSEETPSAQQTQHLYLRHYRPSGPIPPSDFMEDFKLSQENFRKSQAQAQKIKSQQNSQNISAEPMTVAASVVNWGTGKDTAPSSKCSQRCKPQEENLRTRVDQMGIKDESILALK